MALPRVLLLRGVETAAIMDFADMADHLYFLDMVSKERSLSPQQQQDPFLMAHPETRPRQIAVQWPRGLYNLASLWAPALGTGSMWTTLLTNLLFTLLLLGAVVGLGHALADLRVGLWAALLTALNPALLAATFYFSLDFPMLAMVLLALLLLVWSRGYRRWLPTCGFALVSGLGCFIKPTFALYLLCPALVALPVGLASAGAGRRGLVVLRCLVGGALSVGLVLLIWRPDWQSIGMETRVHFLGDQLPGSTTNPWTAEWALTNIKFAVVSYPWPLLLLAAPGLVWLHLGMHRPRGRWALLAFLWGAYLLLTILSTKMERYAQPAYPALCLLTAWWLSRLPPRRWRLPALAAAAGAFALMLAAVQYNPTPWLPRDSGAVSPESAFNSFRYEFVMPGAERLERLRRNRWDAECDLREAVQAAADLVKDHAPPGRPLGAAHLLGGEAGGQDGAMVFRRMIPALMQANRDRYFLVSGLHGTKDLTPAMLHAPALLVWHDAAARPERRYPRLLRLAERRRVTYTCMGRQHQVWISLVLPSQPIPGSDAPASRARHR